MACAMVQVPSSPPARARVYGTPGEQARAAGLVRSLWPLFALVGTAGYVLGAAVPLPGVPKPVYGLVLLVLAFLLVRVLNVSHRLLRNYFKGARGEELVARELAHLPDDYAVFHGLALPAAPGAGVGDLDHVVIGPNGLFLVETKNWSGHVSVRDGRLTVDGRDHWKVSPLDQTRAAADALREWLKRETGHSVAVRPVLCFASSELRGGKVDSGGVLIAGGAALREAILRDPADTLNEGLRRTLEGRLAGQAQEG
jgi:hypothetical protein